MMAVPVKSAGAKFDAGAPQPSFDANFTTTASGSSLANLNLIENWDSGLQK